MLNWNVNCEIVYIYIVVVCFPLHHELLPIWAFCKYATLKKKKLIRRNGGLRPADSLWENKITGWMLSFFFSFSFLIIWICNGLFNKPWYGYRKWALILFIYLFIFYDLWQVSSWQTGCITQSKNKTGKKKKKISNKKFILFGWQLDQPTKSI